MQEIDVIIVSDARTDELKETTEQAIDTCREGGLKINICVVEKQDVKYDAITIRQPEPFNYNACLNKGAKMGIADYIAFCNNDLIFTKNWAKNLIRCMEENKCSSGAPFCPTKHKRQLKMNTSIVQWKVGISFPGWCFMWHRGMYEDVGLSEEYTYWCSDNIAALEAEKKGYQNILCSHSKVTHLGNITGQYLTKEQQDYHTWQNAKKFKENHWNLFPDRL